MAEPITIILAGEPRGKGRPRFAGGVAYTDAKTRAYEHALAWAAQAEMGSRAPTDSPVTMLVEVRMPVPQSWSRARRTAALAGKILPLTKPDADNVLKGAADALNHIVFVDDKQIVEATVRKIYHEKPALIIRVSESKKNAPDLD